MATTSDGGLVVASVQNGEADAFEICGRRHHRHARLADGSGQPQWRLDQRPRGFRQSGLCLGHDEHTALTAGGQATVADASDGGTDAFVFGATDNGTSATANTVSYVGAPGGSTAAGNVRSVPTARSISPAPRRAPSRARRATVQNVNNAFVTALSSGRCDRLDAPVRRRGRPIDRRKRRHRSHGLERADALGLPSGTVSINQSVDLSSNTTLRHGQFLPVADGRHRRPHVHHHHFAGRNAADAGRQINSELLSAGKATMTYSPPAARRSRSRPTPARRSI